MEYTYDYLLTRVLQFFVRFITTLTNFGDWFFNTDVPVLGVPTAEFILLAGLWTILGFKLVHLFNPLN